MRTVAPTLAVWSAEAVGYGVLGAIGATLAAVGLILHSSSTELQQVDDDAAAADKSNADRRAKSKAA